MTQPYHPIHGLRVGATCIEVVDVWGPEPTPPPAPHRFPVFAERLPDARRHLVPEEAHHLHVEGKALEVPGVQSDVTVRIGKGSSSSTGDDDEGKTSGPRRVDEVNSIRLETTVESAKYLGGFIDHERSTLPIGINIPKTSTSTVFAAAAALKNTCAKISQSAGTMTSPLKLPLPWLVAAKVSPNKRN